jgi:catechol 2,3-dioxygenase-like lactoylglutathione lyase family enzyme
MEAARPSWPEETIPVLHGSDAAAALRWYERLGFAEEWTHRFEPGFPAFMSIRRGGSGPGVRIFLSEHGGDTEPKGVVYLRVADVAPLAAEFDIPVRDSGARYEIALTDPDGNKISVGAPTGRSEPGYTAPD